MMLPRYLTPEPGLPLNSIDLNDGVPTIAGLAWLAAASFGRQDLDGSGLSREARALLVAARDRGIFELRASASEFDSSDRLLAVCVEASANKRLTFRRNGNPRLTARFLGAFRELCASGLVIHQLQKEFALTSKGFELADQLPSDEYSSELAFGQASEI